MKKIALISVTILSLSVTGIASASILLETSDLDLRTVDTTVKARDGQEGPRGHRGGRRGGHRGVGMAMTMLQVADTDGDNTVTRDELNALQASEFDHRDRNGDGYLDSQDMSPATQQIRQLRQERIAERVAASEGVEPRRRHRRMDADEDGRVSHEEFLSRETRMFDRLDANGDDAITPDELDAAVENRRERGEARFWWRG